MTASVLVLAAVVAFVVLASLPASTSTVGLSKDIDPEADHGTYLLGPPHAPIAQETSDLRLLVGRPVVTHYDPRADVTYAAFGWCSHGACGAAVKVQGDARARLHAGSHFLVPLGAEVSLEPLEPPLVDRQGREIAQAFTVFFEPRPVWPEAVAGALAFGLLGAGIALVAQPWMRGSATPAAVAAVTGACLGLLLRVRMGWMAVIPGMLILAIAVLLGLASTGLVASRRTVPDWLATATMLTVMAALVIFRLPEYWPADSAI